MCGGSGSPWTPRNTSISRSITHPPRLPKRAVERRSRPSTLPSQVLRNQLAAERTCLSSGMTDPTGRFLSPRGTWQKRSRPRKNPGPQTYAGRCSKRTLESRVPHLAQFDAQVYKPYIHSNQVDAKEPPRHRSQNERPRGRTSRRKYLKWLRKSPWPAWPSLPWRL